MKQELYSRSEVAKYLGLSEATLETWACTGRYNLPFIKVGRLVRYRKSDIDSWLQKRTTGE